MDTVIRVVLCGSLLLATSTTEAQDPPSTRAAELTAPGPRPTGLPASLDGEAPAPDMNVGPTRAERRRHNAVSAVVVTLGASLLFGGIFLVLKGLAPAPDDCGDGLGYEWCGPRVESAGSVVSGVILVVGGSVTLATGVVRLASGPGRDEEERLGGESARLRLQPYASRRGGGLAIGGAF